MKQNKDCKSLCLVDLGDITNWSSVKSTSNWVAVNFVDANYPNG